MMRKSDSLADLPMRRKWVVRPSRVDAGNPRLANWVDRHRSQFCGSLTDLLPSNRQQCADLCFSSRGRPGGSAVLLYLSRDGVLKLPRAAFRGELYRSFPRSEIAVSRTPSLSTHSQASLAARRSPARSAIDVGFSEMGSSAWRNFAATGAGSESERAGEKGDAGRGYSVGSVQRC